MACFCPYSKVFFPSSQDFSLQWKYFSIYWSTEMHFHIRDRDSLYQKLKAVVLHSKYLMFQCHCFCSDWEKWRAVRTSWAILLTAEERTMAALIFKLNKTTTATDWKLVPMKYGKSIQCLSTVSGAGKIILEHLIVYFNHCEEPQLPINSSRLMDCPLVISTLLLMLWYHSILFKCRTQRNKDPDIKFQFL